MTKHLYLLAFLLSLPFLSSSKHIIGGIITYECVGGGTYNFKMTMYRDCSDQTGAFFDFNAPVAIYKGDSQIPISSFYVNYNTPIEDIEPSFNNPCLQLPQDLCVQQAVYEFSYTFAEWPSEDSYHITYQRCCRNANVVNIENANQVGATFTVEILPASQAVCNNSPSYDKPSGPTFPPIVICGGEELNYDHTAFDLDGDQLIYEMCEPLTGGGQGGLGGGDPDACDGITPDPACPPPYSTVTFVNPPYNVLTPLGGNPAVSINPVTGILSGVPTVLGKFVVGVCVREFRNGELMSVIRRDFQFNVANCAPTVVAELEATTQIDEDNYSITACNEFEIAMNNISFEEEFIDNYWWEFDINGQTQIFEEWSPTITFPAHGIYNGMLMLNPGEDCGDTAFVEVNIFPEVVADFAFEYDTCVAGPVFFSDQSYFIGGESSIATWDWDFADSQVDTFHSPSHVYEDPDDYYVVLNVVDENGCTDNHIELVRYKPVPALLIVSPNDVVSCPPGEITFNNLSNPINNEYQINWDFGDGRTSEEISPTHVYQEPGFYSIKLEITSPENCFTDTLFTDLIEIQDPPIARFTCDPERATNLEPTVSFFDDSENTVAWEWFINQTLTSHEQNPVFNFQDTGWQEVTLIVTHPQFCQDTISKLIDVEPLVFWHMPNAFTPNEDTVNDDFYGKGLMRGATNFEMRIWDRWGKMVFQTTDPDEPWNGQIYNSGRQAQAGIYIYTVNFTGPRGQSHEVKGHATLMR